MTKKLEPLYGWHFFNDDGTTGMNNLPVVTGQTMTVKGPLVLCEHGLHFSLRALDALQYAPGARVQRVRIEGQRILDTDKGVARRRTCLWQADATRTLHEFALWCAEQALALIDNPDPRSLRALEVKRLWLDGKASDSELAAAREAAWGVAWGVASDSELAAAWDAAGDAAGDAARDAQNEQLERMLMALKPGGVA